MIDKFRGKPIDRIIDNPGDEIIDCQMKTRLEGLLYDRLKGFGDVHTSLCRGTTAGQLNPVPGFFFDPSFHFFFLFYSSRATGLQHPTIPRLQRVRTGSLAAKMKL